MNETSNFYSWHERIGVVLEEQRVWEFVDNVPVAPNDPWQFAQHNRTDVKAEESSWKESKTTLFLT